MELLASAKQRVQDWYIEYGNYVNTTRGIPGLDGLKPVQRRILLSLNDHAKDKFFKSITIIGHCNGHYHPHGDASVSGALTTLVNNNVVIGQGQWGIKLYTHLGASAPRYTEVKMTKEQGDYYFKLKDYAEHRETEIPGNFEPINLHLPFPVTLITGTSGIGVGCATKIPSFTKDSLVKALTTDNPKKLKVNIPNLHVVDSEFKDLWEHGKGSITYSYSVFKEFSKLDNAEVVVVEGNGAVFTPRLRVAFREWLDEGLVQLRDESTDKVRVVILKTKKVRRINIDDIHERAKRAGRKKVGYCIKIWDYRQNKVRQIGIKEWVETCQELYVKNFNQYCEDNANKREIEIRLLEKLPPITYDMGKRKNRLSDEEILEKHAITKDELHKIDNMPMKFHRIDVVRDRIARLSQQIKEFNKQVIK